MMTDTKGRSTVTSEPPRITVLISGSGTNLQALIDALPTELRPATIVRVISNRKRAYGLERAAKADIPTTYHNLVRYKKAQSSDADGEIKAREEYDADLAALVLSDRSNLVVCAGFMHVLSPSFLSPLSEHGIDIINLHPAKWGQFDGAGAISRAHEAFLAGQIKETGVMIHYVIAAVDRGELVIEATIPLSHPEDDSIATLEERIHAVEHKLIVQGTQIALQRQKERFEA